MTAAPPIELNDVFRFHRSAAGGVAALQGLTLTVEHGETLVVLGPSGAGKSTLLRLLAGLDRPSAGRVRLYGLDVARTSPRALAAWREANLGYADQRYTRALAAELTALELVGLRLALAGVPADARRQRAASLLERVGLAGREGARPAQLSGGEQQRVALCAALAHRPRLLLADEPTGELDAATAAGVYALLRELAAEEGVTAVVVSHDPGSAAIADRVVHIRDGRLAGEAAGGTAGAGAGADAGVPGPPEEIVVGRGGWLHVPEELLREAGIGRRATVQAGEAGLLLLPASTPAPTPTPTPAERRSVPVAPPPEVLAERGQGRGAAVRGLVKAYGGRRVLDGLDAAFPAGALVAVVGPSGSGKTTLLHILAGLVLPDVGEVEVDGRALAGLGREARAALRRQAIGWVGQSPGLVPHLDARENIELGLAVRGSGAAEAAAAATELLALVGLAGRDGLRVSRLSSGERQRVAVARALAARPALLLADEPTARLDYESARATGVLLDRLARETGTAVVCATHDSVLARLATSVVTLA